MILTAYAMNEGLRLKKNDNENYYISYIYMILYYSANYYNNRYMDKLAEDIENLLMRLNNFNIKQNNISRICYKSYDEAE